MSRFKCDIDSNGRTAEFDNISKDEKNKVADGTMPKSRGVVNDVAVTFGELKTKIDFVLVESVLVGLLIRIPEMEGLTAQIDLEASRSTLPSAETWYE